MKNILKITNCLLIILTLVIGCKSPNNNSVDKNGFIEGKVIEIARGKDGYTAKINTSFDSIYFVTISHANLLDPKQYKNVGIGETIEVKGDIWKMEKENHITVRELK